MTRRHGNPSSHPAGATAPRVIAWETTRRCPMRCRHCRGGARNIDYSGELTTAEGHRLIDSLATLGRPVLILTGGEPMARKDIYDLAEHASESGLRVAMAPCGPMLNPMTAARLKEAGVQRISLSLDGATADTHDAFRGVDGAYDAAMDAMMAAREAQLPFQINTTVSTLNAAHLEEIHALACRLGAAALDLFFLVPTGRGRALSDLALSPEDHEKTLFWVLQARRSSPIPIRVTCAPTMARLERQHGNGQQAAGHGQRASGCLAGRGFLFISHRGILQPCGFLDLACGDLREGDFDVKTLYEASTVLESLSDRDALHGSCGRCAFRHVCGGCRARAFAAGGDVSGQDPSCGYQPTAGEGEA